MNKALKIYLESQHGQDMFDKCRNTYAQYEVLRNPKRRSSAIRKLSLIEKKWIWAHEEKQIKNARRRLKTEIKSYAKMSQIILDKITEENLIFIKSIKEDGGNGVSFARDMQAWLNQEGYLDDIESKEEKKLEAVFLEDPEPDMCKCGRDAIHTHNMCIYCYEEKYSEGYQELMDYIHEHGYDRMSRSELVDTCKNFKLGRVVLGNQQ